jgi:hypothetical protein
MGADGCRREENDQDQQPDFSPEKFENSVYTQKIYLLLLFWDASTGLKTLDQVR